MSKHGVGPRSYQIEYLDGGKVVFEAVTFAKIIDIGAFHRVEVRASYGDSLSLSLRVVLYLYCTFYVLLELRVGIHQDILLI